MPTNWNEIADSFATGLNVGGRLRRLREEIEQSNFQRDRWLQQEEERKKALERETRARKSLIGLNKDRLRNSLADLDPEDQARYGAMLDADVDETSSTFNEYLQTIGAGISEARQRKTQLDAAAKEKKAETAKSDELQRQYAVFNKRVSLASLQPDQQAQLDEFLDGSKEGLDAAKELLKGFTTKEKPDKVTLSEEKASLTEEILSLGNDDIEAGLAQLRQVDPDKYRRALALGIKSTKTEDEAPKIIEKIEAAYKSRPEQAADTTLRNFAEQWLSQRTYIDPEVQKQILGSLTPMDSQRNTGIMTGMQKAGFAPSAPAPAAPSAPIPTAPATPQLQTAQQNPDQQRYEALLAKFKADPSSLSDEELDWLQQYRERQKSSAQPVGQ